MSRIKFALAATAAAAATLAASAAHAQSNVTLYGLIDTTISTVNNTIDVFLTHDIEWMGINLLATGGYTN